MDATKKSVLDTVNTSARMINAWFVEDVSRGRIRIIFGFISKNTLKEATLIAKPRDPSMNLLIASTAEKTAGLFFIKIEARYYVHIEVCRTDTALT